MASEWGVEVLGAPPGVEVYEGVRADYYRVGNAGEVTFYNENPGGATPKKVISYAPGTWRTVFENETEA